MACARQIACDASRLQETSAEFRQSLNIDHLDDVRSDIRMIVFTFANLNPAAAAQYLTGINSETITYHDQQALLKSPGTLPDAAPRSFADFVLGTLIRRMIQIATIRGAVITDRSKSMSTSFWMCQPTAAHSSRF